MLAGVSRSSLRSIHLANSCGLTLGGGHRRRDREGEPRPPPRPGSAEWCAREDLPARQLAVALALPGCSLRELKLGGSAACGGGGGGRGGCALSDTNLLEYIAGGLALNTSIETLTIYNADITAPAAAALALALQSNTCRVDSLHLANISLDDDPDLEGMNQSNTEVAMGRRHHPSSSNGGGTCDLLWAVCRNLRKLTLDTTRLGGREWLTLCDGVRHGGLDEVKVFEVHVSMDSSVTPLHLFDLRSPSHIDGVGSMGGGGGVGGGVGPRVRRDDVSCRAHFAEALAANPSVNRSYLSWHVSKASGRSGRSGRTRRQGRRSGKSSSSSSSSSSLSGSFSGRRRSRSAARVGGKQSRKQSSERQGKLRRSGSSTRRQRRKRSASGGAGERVRVYGCSVPL